MTQKEEDQKRMEALLAGATFALRRRFLEVVKNIGNRYTLEELQQLLAERRFDEALVTAELAAAGIASTANAAFVRAAEDTMARISRAIRVVVGFDQTNVRAVEAMRQSHLRLIREFTNQQRLATRLALVEGISQGLNPRQQALLFRQSIGLTRKQMQAVINYRRLLEVGDAAALERALRDKRFDPSVRAAVSGERPLTPTQIDRMVDRYRDRYLAHRAETIARTEALRSVHDGAQEAYRQAIDLGVLAADDLVQEWITAADERVRGSHSFMHGQQRPIGEPFLSGDGNQLRWPGDIDAPGSETIQCRCVLTTVFVEDAQPREEVA